MLLGISKRGDAYLRTLLIHGARAVMRFAEKKTEPDSWLHKLIARRNKNVASLKIQTSLQHVVTHKKCFLTSLHISYMRRQYFVRAAFCSFSV
jgi:hypothetical protein